MHTTDLSIRPFPSWLGTVAVILALSGLAGGCDATVEPVTESDRTYSVYALLDPAADTQFVRVEALRDDTPIGAPDTIDAAVTLRNRDSGRVISLRDSLTTVGLGIPTHVFWTDASLAPGATYDLVVERSDGAASSATITLPSSPPDLSFDEPPLLPCVDAQNEGRAEFLAYATGADRLAGAYALYPVLGELARRANYRDIVLQRDTFRIPVDHVQDLQAIADGQGPEDLGCPPRSAFATDSVFVAVATAGPDWPPGIDSLSIDALARPDVAQNVENGAGLVGGIYTDTLGVPIEFSD